MRPTTPGLYSHFALGSLLIAGLLVPLGAQQPPVFRSGVDLVTVDVTVLDGSGRPVEGIGADRFDVRVDGVPRRVVWAEYVRHHTKPLAPADSSPHFDTNEGMNPGRLVLVAVDQAHIRRIEGRSALRAAASFIDALEPTDRVAGAPLTHGGAIQFTSDHASVKTYLQTLTGTAVPVPAHFNIGLSEALAISDGSRTRLDQAVLRECGTKLSRLENPARIAEAEGMRDPCPVQLEQESRADCSTVALRRPVVCRVARAADCASRRNRRSQDAGGRIGGAGGRAPTRRSHARLAPRRWRRGCRSTCCSSRLRYSKRRNRPSPRLSSRTFRCVPTASRGSREALAARCSGSWAPIRIPSGAS